MNERPGGRNPAAFACVCRLDTRLLLLYVLYRLRVMRNREKIHITEVTRGPTAHSRWRKAARIRLFGREFTR